MKTAASKLTLTLPVLAFAGIAFAGNAFAGNPAMRLSDNAGNIVMIDVAGTATSGGTCTAATCSTVSSSGANPGSAVSWTGKIGDFTLSAIGQSQAQLGAQAVDISLQNVHSGSVGGTLTALWTDTGFAAASPYVYSGQALLTGTGSFTQTGYGDASNVQFGTAVLIATPVPAADGSFFASGLAGPSGSAISLTEKVVVTLGPNSTFFNDFGMAASIPALSLSCPAAIGTPGSSYGSSLQASGGLSPYTFSISAGTLPSGLALDPVTGVISGVPGTGGSYTFTGKVTDSSGDPTAGVATSACTILLGGSIGDRVWTDTNANGIQDTGETGISGMALTLSLSGTIVGTTTTGTNGAYSFGGLAAGAYTVCTSPSISLTQTYDLDGTTSKNCAAVTLAGGQNRTDVDFGYVTSGSGGGGTGQGSNVCGVSPGYWKTHSSVWPVSTLTLGAQTYNKSELLNLLNAPKGGDSTLILAFQLIAAKLNVANGTKASTAGTNITTADQLLSSYGHLPLSKGIKDSQMTAIGTNLNSFNADGLLQPGCTMPQ